MSQKEYTLYNADCFDIFPTIPDNSVDLVLCDPPYGITQCKWDTAFDFALMWAEINRVAKERSALVFTACQPFTSLLVCSNLKRFRYEWIWQKNMPSGFLNAKYGPMRAHESVLVFSADSKATVYYPIKEPREKKLNQKRMREPLRRKKLECGPCYHKIGPVRNLETELRYPFSVQKFPVVHAPNKEKHPTQKPVSLMEYFIITYSRDRETVLDFAMGSGTTGVACADTNRRFIGIEKDEKYFNLAKKRIEQAYDKATQNR